MRPVVAVTLVLALSQAGLNGPVSLGGSWVPDPSVSERSKELKAPDPRAPPAPPAPPAGAPKLRPLRIAHDGPTIVFEVVGEEGSPLSSERITTDGQEHVSARGGGELTHVSLSRWDGASLRTEWRLTQAGADIMTGVDVWSLADDRASLIHTSSMEDSKSHSTAKTVYRRK